MSGLLQNLRLLCVVYIILKGFYQVILILLVFLLAFELVLNKLLTV